ncbi:MAG: phage baseplate protein, partial [Pyrinomonadaceae bacterium]
MQELSTQDVLGVWEIGKYQTLPERALTLLAAYCPEMSSQELERMNIGARDALLLRLREVLFGSHFVGLTTCPRCCTSLEIEFNSSEVRAHEPTVDTFKLSFEGYEFTCRLPNSSDLLALVPG